MPILGDNDRFGEKCAVFGVYNVGPLAAHLTYYGLMALQHRGQEASGIVSSDGRRLYRHAAAGLVTQVYAAANFKHLTGTMAIGHNRYSTSCGEGDQYNQPFVGSSGRLALAHNGNLPDCRKLEAFLKAKGVAAHQLNDSGMMTAVIDWHIGQGQNLRQAIINSYPLLQGAFSCVAMDGRSLVAFRDECGIRPLCIGRLGTGYIVASETCALEAVGATFEREVRPGELVAIDESGLSSMQVVPGRQKLDIFELVYFARPDSIMLGQQINEIRRNFGRQLAAETTIAADVVVPVPDSGIPAALGFAEASGIPFEMGLVKNRYIHRTFIRPSVELREQDLKMKLTPVGQSLHGKRVVLIDDSIVRGTTMRSLIGRVIDAGAAEVHLVISSPPVRYPDFYGIDTPEQRSLLAARMSVDEIRQYFGVSSLHYLSYDGMIAATGLPADMFSTSCFNGEYPIPIGQRAHEVSRVFNGPKLQLPAGYILPETVAIM